MENKVMAAILGFIMITFIHLNYLVFIDYSL